MTQAVVQMLAPSKLMFAGTANVKAPPEKQRLLAPLTAVNQPDGVVMEFATTQKRQVGAGLIALRRQHQREQAQPGQPAQWVQARQLPAVEARLLE